MKGYRNLGLFSAENDFIKFEQLANKINMSQEFLIELFIHDLVQIEEDGGFQTDGIKGVREFYNYWKYISTGE